MWLKTKNGDPWYRKLPFLIVSKKGEVYHIVLIGHIVYLKMGEDEIYSRNTH
jgi:hypothetical protein